MAGMFPCSLRFTPADSGPLNMNVALWWRKRGVGYNLEGSDCYPTIYLITRENVVS